MNSDLNTSLQIGHVTSFASSPGGTTTNRARSSASRLALSAFATALTFDKRDEGPGTLSPLLKGKSWTQSYTKRSQSQFHTRLLYCSPQHQGTNYDYDRGQHSAMPYGSAGNAYQDALAWPSCPVLCRKIGGHTAYIVQAYGHRENALCSCDVCQESEPKNIRKRMYSIPADICT